MSEPVPTTPAAHATHDAALIAALAARPTDLSDLEGAAARDLVGTCTGCADLLADLLTLQVALPATSTPRRPRDFTLTADDVDRLRGGWRRMLGFFGSARDGFTRPLAAGLTTLGLVGLLVATVPSITSSGGAATLSTVGAAIPNGAAGAAPAPAEAASAAPSMEAATGSDRVAAQAEPDATKLDQESTFSGAAELDSSSERDVAGDAGIAIRSDASGLSVLFVVAGVMLIVGLGLFLLRWSARRLT